jgi:hypothetical protein
MEINSSVSLALERSYPEGDLFRRRKSKKTLFDTQIYTNGYFPRL